MPDFGYPEYTGGGGPDAAKRRHAWTANTISHNSVVVDQVSQQREAAAKAEMFTDSDFVKAAFASGPDNYESTETYERIILLVDIDETHSYLIDVFSIRGGSDHLYSFHATEGEVKRSGLELARREGTLAGEDVAYAQLEVLGSNVWRSAEEPRSGYDYLYNIEHDPGPPQTWSAEWTIKDSWKALEGDCDVGLKLTMISKVDEVFFADGDPPQVGKGNPRRLKFVLAHRSGEQLETCFVSVIEPFRGESNIESVEQQKHSDSEGATIGVQLKGGMTDTFTFPNVASPCRGASRLRVAEQVIVQRGNDIVRVGPFNTQ